MLTSRLTLLKRGHTRFYSAVVQPGQKKSILSMHDKFKRNVPITMVTCYDYTSAKLVDEVGLDAVLVGDSYKMVMSGEGTTVPATMEGKHARS